MLAATASGAVAMRGVPLYCRSASAYSVVPSELARRLTAWLAGAGVPACGVPSALVPARRRHQDGASPSFLAEKDDLVRAIASGALASGIVIPCESRVRGGAS